MQLESHCLYCVSHTRDYRKAKTLRGANAKDTLASLSPVFLLPRLAKIDAIDDAMPHSCAYAVAVTMLCRSYCVEVVSF